MFKCWVNQDGLDYAVFKKTVVQHMEDCFCCTLFLDKVFVLLWFLSDLGWQRLHPDIAPVTYEEEDVANLKMVLKSYVGLH